jgi:hypothetical protein
MRFGGSPAPFRHTLPIFLIHAPSTFTSSDYQNNWWKPQVAFNFVHFPCNCISYTICNTPKCGIYHCYAHEDICKLCGWFGNSRSVGWSWPRSGHPLVCFLSYFCRCCPRCLGEWKVLLRQLPCAVTEMRFCDVLTGVRRGERSLSGQILERSVSAFPEFQGFSYFGSLITVCRLPLC